MPSSLFHLHGFLSSPLAQTLLLSHPNQLIQHNPPFTAPQEWASWWEWAGQACPSADMCTDVELAERSHNKWLLHLRYYSEPNAKPLAGAFSFIPSDLKSLVDNARHLQITREPGPLTALGSPFSVDLGDAHSRIEDVKLAPPLPTASQRSDTAKEGNMSSGDQDESRLRGMSPKKAHEVSRMTRYITRLLSRPELQGVKHVVDVGAGQVRFELSILIHPEKLFRPVSVTPHRMAVHSRSPPLAVEGGAMIRYPAYLSRSLRDGLGLHVLALDWSDVQTKGAARKEKITTRNREQGPSTATDADTGQCGGSSTGRRRATDAQRNGSLTYKTLKITSDTLFDAVDEWISSEARPVERATECGTSCRHSDAIFGPTPVLFVALHACGSLTPNILRTFVTNVQDTGSARVWLPRAAVVVGCCYNLLESADFPLSVDVSTRPVTLTSNHLQLAAQVPSQWMRTEASLRAAALAIRKVVWRALLSRILERREDPAIDGQDIDPQNDRPFPAADSLPSRRLGRLNDSAYADWETFLARAGEKLGINLNGEIERDPAMESRLEVLQVLRCILGPVVETLILLDRQQWLTEELQDSGVDVQLVNLFDQASGSGRNVAIVVAPKLPTIV